MLGQETETLSPNQILRVCVSNIIIVKFQKDFFFFVNWPGDFRAQLGKVNNQQIGDKEEDGKAVLQDITVKWYVCVLLPRECLIGISAFYSLLQVYEADNGIVATHR